MRTVDAKWKYAAMGLGGLVVLQFLWWNQKAPAVLGLNVPRLPFLGS